MSLKHSMLVLHHRHSSFTCFWQFWGSAWYSQSCKWSNSWYAPSRKASNVTVIIFPSCQIVWKQYRAFLLLINKKNCGIVRCFNKSKCHEEKKTKNVSSVDCEFLSAFATVKTVIVIMQWSTTVPWFAFLCLLVQVFSDVSTFIFAFIFCHLAEDDHALEDSDSERDTVQTLK